MDACTPADRPNILMILVDQLYFTPYASGDGGMIDPIKEILTFQGDLSQNPYRDVFPGLCKLRQFGVVLGDHSIAESACIPSRASLMTGQYGPRTGVTQTDGLFKSGDASAFPWLPANGAPTLGDWMSAIGYSSHYFGKWHVSNPPEHSLRAYGFDDWELSWPEPHGSLVNNLGTFRDVQFADLACAFLRNRGLGLPYSRSTAQQDLDHPLHMAPVVTPPFFAVCSFTNPHDIAAYPALCRAIAPLVWDPADQAWVATDTYGPGGAVPIPPLGSVSSAPKGGSMHIPLNPHGLPQDCATPPPTMDEALLANNKPRSHYDYSVKVGLGLSAKTGLSVAQKVASNKAKEGTPISAAEANHIAVESTLLAGAPFNTQVLPQAAAVGFLQYYVYMISMVDRHILAVLNTLEESGLRKNTLLVFAADHGEMGAAHGMMMEKWHTAYQEVLHVPVIFSHPSLNPSPSQTIVLDAQTSHVDILPTLLGYVGADVEAARQRLSRFKKAAPFAGVDLSPLIKGESKVPCYPNGEPRQGVLFATDDMITEPLPRDADPHNLHSWAQYGVYQQAVEVLRGAEPNLLPAAGRTPALQPGPVCQPCHVRALRSGEWKLVRNCDPWSAVPEPDQWELYNLRVDPYEQVNLVDVNNPVPTPIASAADRVGLAEGDLQGEIERLRLELVRQEAAYLSPYPAPYPTAGASRGH